MKRAAFALPLLLALVGCGAALLDAHFAPPPTPTEATVAESISRAELRKERPVAVGITTDPPRLCAWDLTGGLLWERPVQPKSAPLVVGNAVVIHENAGIVVRDLDSGEVRVTLEDDGELIGADAVESAVVISIAHRNGTPRGTLIFVSNGDVRWKKTLAQPVGMPALVRNQVLVPWGTQRLSVLSASDGSELARWDFQNLVIGRALVDRGLVYVGQHGLLRVAADLPERRYGAVSLHAPSTRPLPGQPAMLHDGYAAVPAPDSAEHRVRLEWRPAHGQSSGVEDDLLVFAFYRLLFGLSAQKDDVRWVRHFEHDVVGMFKQPGGVFLADDAGSVRFVDAAGATRFVRELERPLRMVTLRPGTLLSGETVAEAPAQAAALELPEATLHGQLLAAAELNDFRLAPGRVLAVQHLARTSAPSVTKELIGLCKLTAITPESVNDAGRRAACDELAKRETGQSDVLEALRERASWLEGTQQPQVSALAQAAAHMGLSEAGPLLLNHLENPHTSSQDLVQVLLAIQGLQYRPAVPQLERFLRLHHAEPEGSELAPALQGALLALGALHGSKVRSTVAAIADDQLSLPQVRQTAKEVLVALDAPVPVKPAEPKAASKVVVKDVIVEEVILTDPRPYALGLRDAQKAFRPLAAGLQRCLQSDPAEAKSARLSMIVSGDGRVEGFLATPTSLQACVEPILRNARFAVTRLGRQHLVHTVQLDAHPE